MISEENFIPLSIYVLKKNFNLTGNLAFQGLVGLGYIIDY